MDKPLMFYVEEGDIREVVIVVGTGVTDVYQESALELSVYNDGLESAANCVYRFGGVAAKNLFARLKKLCV
jgi:hypothetical protein